MIKLDKIFDLIDHAEKTNKPRAVEITPFVLSVHKFLLLCAFY